MQTLIFATSNPNKVKEIKAFFGDMDVSIQSLLDYPEIPEAPEPYDTFHENALERQPSYDNTCLVLSLPMTQVWK